MLVKRPIFIVGFARSGSNIVLNLLFSHPRVARWGGEVNRIFKGRPVDSTSTRMLRWLRYLPIVVAEQREIFYAGSWTDRRPFSAFTRKRVDQILYNECLRSPVGDAAYAGGGSGGSRLLLKTLNGLLFLSRNFAEMYPDATFIGLVRNGYAVCEGHIRRRRYTPEQIAINYHKGCQRLLEDSQSIPNFHIFRFEDIIRDPVDSLSQIYAAADLEMAAINKVRLQKKPVITLEGRHSFQLNSGQRKETVWYDLQDLKSHFCSDVNQNQTKRLDQTVRDIITKHAGPSLESFGYK